MLLLALFENLSVTLGGSGGAECRAQLDIAHFHISILERRSMPSLQVSRMFFLVDLQDYLLYYPPGN